MNKITTLLREGQPVRLWTPDNPRIHEARGRIKTVTGYGAVVETTAAGSGEFRALTEEIIPLEGEEGTMLNEVRLPEPIPSPSSPAPVNQSMVETPVGLTVPKVGFARPERTAPRGLTPVAAEAVERVFVTNQASPLSSREIARESGYIGDPCDTCGSLKVRRKGVCLNCEECGASGGCG